MIRVTLALAAALVAAPALAQTAVQLEASDGVKVQGALRKAQGRAKGMILLFHMAGATGANMGPSLPASRRRAMARSPSTSAPAATVSEAATRRCALPAARPDRIRLLDHPAC